MEDAFSVPFILSWSTSLRLIIGNKLNIDDNLILSFLIKEIDLMNMQIQITWSKILEG